MRKLDLKEFIRRSNLIHNNCNDINPKNKKTFGELYKETQIRKKAILNAGFNLIEIWDSDWKQLREEINNP